MICSLCSRNNKSNNVNKVECLELALDSIRKHFFSFRNSLDEKDRQIELLQQRSEKLARAVELLQRNSTNNNSPIKRRKSNGFNNSDIEFSQETESPTSDLNIALNSAQLLSSSILSSVSNDSIEEINKHRSPRQLSSLPDDGKTLREKFKPYDKTLSNEKKKPLQNINENIPKLMSGKKEMWLSKQQTDPIYVSSRSKFLKPESVFGLKNKMFLSVKKKASDKPKRIPLQLDISQNNCTGNDATFCSEIIDASPNQIDQLQQPKATRSWLLRTNKNINITGSTQKSINFLDDSDDSGDGFNYSNNRTSGGQNLFDLDEHETKDSLSCLYHHNEPVDSSSIMLLPPESPEIIFLDESCDKTQIKTLDLLQGIGKTCEDTLEKLKRIESKNILKLQNEMINVGKQDEYASQLILEPSAGVTKEKKNFAKTSSVSDFKLKPTTESLSSAVNCHDNEYEKDEKQKEEDEEFMVRPIIIKLETKSPKKLSIKERFNIDCTDCEKYIGFLADRLTDKEIDDHLRKCTRHKQRDISRSNTPEGYWDPLMRSFDENDPRNEVLIDNRFVGKNRNK